MDNTQNANISGGNLSLVTSLDQNDQVRSHHEVMIRRMKNRERQRRYRARKRLAAERMLTYTSHTPQYVEADARKGPTSLPIPKEIKRRRRRKKETTMDQFTSAQIEMPLQYLEADAMKGPTSMPLPKEIKRRRRRKKETTMNQFYSVPIEIPLIGTPHDFATRVHSRRDWKRDARRAHIIKEQEVRPNDPVIPVVTSVSGSGVQTFASGVYPPLNRGCQSGGAILDPNEAPKAVPSRRHWKEEARNKKS